MSNSATPGYVTLQHFRHGRANVLLCLRADGYIGHSVELFGEYSEAEVDVFRWFVRIYDVVIDAGALFGEHTLALAELCPRGRVLAFEPQRIPFQVLCANVQLNSLDNVECSKAALGNENGLCRVASLDPWVERFWGNARIGPTFEERLRDKVRIRTIDSCELARLDFVKLDVEGFEPQILMGGRETIRRCQPVLYIEFNENRQELLGLLRELGYKTLFRHLAPVHRFPNYNMRRVEETLCGMLPPPSDMLLALPSGRDLPVSEATLVSEGGFERL